MVFLVSSAPTTNEKKKPCLNNRFLITVPDSCGQGMKFKNGKCRTVTLRFATEEKEEEEEPEKNDGCTPDAEEKPAVKNPTTKKPAAKNPTTKKPAAKNPTTEKPRTKTSSKSPCPNEYELIGNECKYVFQ